MLVYIIIAAIGILTMGMIVVFADPSIIARLVKKIFKSSKRNTVKIKARKPTPLEMQIEQMAPGQLLRFKVPGQWGSGFITVELNPQYPQSGRKYILSSENAVNGMPGDNKTTMYVSDQAMEIAASVMQRSGELFITPGGKADNSAKVMVGAKASSGNVSVPTSQLF